MAANATTLRVERLTAWLLAGLLCVCSLSAFARQSSSGPGKDTSPTQSGAAAPAASAMVFEVATIKPAAPSPDGHTHINYPPGGRFSAANITLLALMEWAYETPARQIMNGPDWLGSTRFDLQATSAPEVNRQLRSLQSSANNQAKRQMVQALLEERFSLRLHRETRTLPAYVLSIAKDGSKLQVSTVNGKSISTGRASLRARGLPMELVAEELSRIVGRPVLDDTHLRGRYDIDLHWTPDDETAASETAAPSFPTALQEQLGLKLVSGKEPIPVLVIDQIAAPSAN